MKDIIALIVGFCVGTSPIWLTILVIKKLSETKSNKGKNNKGPYGTGWTWNSKTQKWDPPANTSKITKANRIEPSYEEWKANREKQEINSTPQNSATEQGTYRYDHIHLANEEVHISKDAPKQSTDNPTKPPKAEKTKAAYVNSYEARSILSYNESRNYKTLKAAADRKGYTVQIKMRLADIIKPRTGEFYDKYYKANFQRISQYHVDFTILNDRMKIIAIIELDDNSHDRPDRIERDEKIDSILEANGIKIIHTRHITEDILDGI